MDVKKRIKYGTLRKVPVSDQPLVNWLSGLSDQNLIRFANAAKRRCGDRHVGLAQREETLRMAQQRILQFDR